jgi:hypothetical protein
MQQEQVITGNSVDEIWQQINADFESLSALNDYHVVLQHGKRRITLDIDIHLGGEEEGGYETTIFTALLPPQNGFRFAIHPEDLLQEVGKFFGLEDKEIGYPEFDADVIVKTNDVPKVHTLLSDAGTRQLFQDLSGYSLSIKDDHKIAGEHLELNILHGITDAGTLKEIYQAYYSILSKLDV